MTYLTMKGFNKTTPPYKTFTISRTEQSNMSSGWTYSDDATWLTAGSTEFDTFFWYYGCRLSSAWAETAKVTQSYPWTLDITQLWTLTSGDNVMIAFPRRWIKMSKSWTQVTLSITDDPNKDGYQYYAHTKGSDIKDALYLWAYMMSSWYKSLSWKTPLTNLTRAGFRSWIKSTYDNSAWTDRYSQVTIYPRWYINALYIMKYGNPNSQSVVWQWYYTGSATYTWWTNSQTNATYWTSSLSSQIKLFWLEDRWGNRAEFLDSCWNNSSTQLTVDKTNSVFNDSAYSTNLWKPKVWWIWGIAWTNDWMFMSTSTAWDGTNYYTDYYDAYTNTVLNVGTWSSGNTSWAFSTFRIVAWNTSDSYWARLMYL